MIVKLIETLIFGALITLAFILISNPLRVNSKANRWFGVFLLFWASFWLQELLDNLLGIQFEMQKEVWFTWLQFFTPVTFFISVCYFTNPRYSLLRHGIKFLILPAFYLALLWVNQELDNKYYQLQLLLLLAHAIIYSVYSLLKIRQHQKNVEEFASSTQEINLNWLIYIILSTLFLTFLVSVFNLLFYEMPLNLFMNLIVLVVVFFIAFHALKQHEIFPRVSAMPETETEEPKRQLLVYEHFELIKQQLENLMATDKPYLDSDLNLMKLADMLGVTPHQLSHVINKGFNENFFQYVNKFRVEKAKQMLANSLHNNLSILGVGFESGFSSKTSFNTTFKKMTGQTPSEFKQAGSSL
jgi:AraC-like DNA-binding protein